MIESHKRLRPSSVHGPRRRVVVTGIGCVSPVGNNPQKAWTSVTGGVSGIGRITHFDATGFPTQIGAEVKQFQLADWLAPDLLVPFEKLDRHIHYGVAAATQAICSSGLDYSNLVDPSRFGVYLGAGEGIPNFELLTRLIVQTLDERSRVDLSRFNELGRPQILAEVELTREPNALASIIAGLFCAEGPNLNTLTACAASAQAIGEATELIRSDVADVMIVGGAHTMIHPFGLTGFCLLGALSTRNDDPAAASRPFDRNRDGFVLGEGAAMLVLEEYSSAKKRGAPIYGEIVGYGLASDAYRLTDVPDDGRGLARAIQRALCDANMNPDDVDYVNAHGTSTMSNDPAETRALKQALGSHARRVPISATKSVTGHLVSVCGALEAIISLLSLRDGIVPPTVNYEFPDPNCDLDYVPNVAREVPLKAVMSNNSGFGGQNISLVMASV